MTDYTQPEPEPGLNFWDTAPSERPVPDVGIFDEPAVCFKLNVVWRGHIIQMLERLLYPDAWEGDVATRFRAQQEIFELILATIEGNCEVEMANCCCPTEVLKTYQTENTTINNDLTIYNDNISNVTNYWDYDDSPDDLDRDLVLCLALPVMVQHLIDTAEPIVIRHNEGLSNKLDDIGDALRFLGGYLGLAELLGLAFVAPELTVAIAAGAAIAEVLDDWVLTEEEVYLDPDVAGEVACCMWENLRGLKPTFTAWCNSLVGCPVSTEYPQFATALTNTICNEALFVEFLKAMGEAVNVVEVLGQYATCPCDDCTPYTVLVDTYAPNGSIGVPAGTEFFNSSTGVTSWLFGAERVAFPLTERGCLGQVHILMANGANEIPPGGSVWAMVGGSTVKVRQSEFLSWDTGQIGTSPYGFGIPNQPGDALILWATDDTDPEGTKIPFAVTRFTEPNGDPALRHFIKP